MVEGKTKRNYALQLKGEKFKKKKKDGDSCQGTESARKQDKQIRATDWKSEFTTHDMYRL